MPIRPLRSKLPHLQIAAISSTRSFLWGRGEESIVNWSGIAPAVLYGPPPDSDAPALTEFAAMELLDEDSDHILNADADDIGAPPDSISTPARSNIDFH